MNFKALILVFLLASFVLLSGCSGEKPENGKGGIGKSASEYFLELSNKSTKLNDETHYKITVESQLWMAYDESSSEENAMESTLLLLRNEDNFKVSVSFLGMTSDSYLWENNFYSCMNAEGSLNCSKSESSSMEAQQIEKLTDNLFKPTEEQMMEAFGNTSLTFKDIFKVKKGKESTVNGRKCQEFSLEVNWGTLLEEMESNIEDAKANTPELSSDVCLDLEYGIGLKQDTIMEMQGSTGTSGKSRIKLDISLSLTSTQEDVKPPMEALDQ